LNKEELSIISVLKINKLILKVILEEMFFLSPVGRRRDIIEQISHSSPNK